MTFDEIILLLAKSRFGLQDEKVLQQEIEQVLRINGITFDREYRLDDKNIPDFFIDGMAVEAKIKGSKRAIFKQCERYCQFKQVIGLLLITNRSMGFPSHINGKPCFVINLGKAWL